MRTAIKSVDEAAVRQLLARGADVNQRWQKGMTPLLLAASLGLPDIVRVLIAAGAQVTHKDDLGYDAEMIAAFYGEFHMGAITDMHREVIRVVRNARRRMNRSSRPGQRPKSVPRRKK